MNGDVRYWPLADIPHRRLSAFERTLIDPGSAQECDATAASEMTRNDHAFIA
jgi:hypothetical protein